MDHEAPALYSAITPTGVSNEAPTFLMKSPITLCSRLCDYPTEALTLEQCSARMPTHCGQRPTSSPRGFQGFFKDTAGLDCQALTTGGTRSKGRANDRGGGSMHSQGFGRQAAMAFRLLGAGDVTNDDTGSPPGRFEQMPVAAVKVDTCVSPSRDGGPRATAMLCGSAVLAAASPRRRWLSAAFRCVSPGIDHVRLLAWIVGSGPAQS
jgi:hypothetical protein